MENTDKEVQHYVPKFYLKKFSWNRNEKQLGIYNINRNLYIAQGKLKTQAYKSFFYGKDGVIENKLSYLESDLAPIISQVILTQKPPKSESLNHGKLLLFFLLTEMRNPMSIDLIHKFRNTLINSSNEIIPDDKWVENNFPKIPHEEAIQRALSDIGLGIIYCADLKTKLLVNNTEIPFITSDNPVIKYNQYLEQRKFPGGWGGLGLIGFEMFMPLDPQTMIVFYDSWVYKVGDRRKDKIYLTKDDVNQLNLLQLLNCDENVFFNEQITRDYMESVAFSSKRFGRAKGIRSKILRKIDEFGNVEENSRIVAMGQENLNINLTINGFALTKQARLKVFDSRAVQMRPHAIKVYTNERNQ